MANRPMINEFDPTLIESQYRFVDSFYNNVQHRNGTQIILLSGAVGSAKSMAMEHVICRMAIEYPGITIGLGRRAMPDLKTTLLQNIIDHMPDELIARRDKQKGEVELINGTKILSYSWADKKFKKVRSTEFTCFAIEEITESDDAEAFKEILMRIRENYAIDENQEDFIEACGGERLKRPPKFLICATNPDSPDHWVYEDIIENAGNVDGKPVPVKGKNPNVHVFYSVTSDNPFLDESYKQILESNLSPKEAERMLYGKWVNISGEGVYHAYDEDIHYIQSDYKPRRGYPILLGFDFNASKNKPMSVVLCQYINDQFHFFHEGIIESSNTIGLMEELEERGIFKLKHKFIIYGDANGWRSESNATNSDYGIMKNFLNHLPYKVNFEVKARRKNPAVKERHNLVNAYMMNLKKQVRLYVYNSCPTLNKGFKSTELKKGATYQEDDSKAYQHCTTGAGYIICEVLRKSIGSIGSRKN